MSGWAEDADSRDKPRRWVAGAVAAVVVAIAIFAAVAAASSIG
jgi:hypothetical protein